MSTFQNEKSELKRIRGGIAQRSKPGSLAIVVKINQDNWKRCSAPPPCQSYTKLDNMNSKYIRLTIEFASANNS